MKKGQELIGQLIINNPSGEARWKMNLVFDERSAKVLVQDSAKYSLFPNSEEMGKGDSIGQAIDDFMSKEQSYLAGL